MIVQSLTLQMPPPHDGNEYIPFEKLVQVKQLDDNTFQSIALPFTPSGKDGAPGVAFGGHVHMQAAWAACQTVAKGFLISVSHCSAHHIYHTSI